MNQKADDDRIGIIGVVCYETALEDWKQPKPACNNHQGLDVTGLGNAEQ